MFPNELKAMPNWVGYVANKTPMNPHTGRAARSNNKETWGTYEQAIDACRRYGFAGLGFMFQEPFIGLDLDDCIVDGAINEFARGVIDRCRSYTEYSPSRTGIHIIGRGKLDASLKKPFLEVYQTERYFTVTQKPIYPVRSISELDLSWLDEYRETRKGPIDVVNKLSEIKEGSRNNDFASLAGSLRSKGYSAEEMFGWLRPRAAEVGFDEKELWNVCKSIGRYTPKIQISSQASSIDEFLKDEEPIDWIVPGVIAKRSIGFVAGLPESKKTWVLMDLAVECARGGGQWLGKFPISGGKVLFIDQERFKGETQRRFRAVMSAKGLGTAELSKSLYIRCGTSTKLDLQPSYEAFHKEVAEIRPDIIVIDSFAAFHSAEENNRQSIQAVLERIKEIRNEFGCTIIFVHHENKYAFNKDDDSKAPSIAEMAGSVAIPAVAEFVLTVRKQDSDSSMVFNTKNTMASTIAPFMVSILDELPDKSKIRVEAH